MSRIKKERKGGQGRIANTIRIASTSTFYSLVVFSLFFRSCSPPILVPTTFPATYQSRYKVGSCCCCCCFLRFTFPFSAYERTNDMRDRDILAYLRSMPALFSENETISTYPQICGSSLKMELSLIKHFLACNTNTGQIYFQISEPRYLLLLHQQRRGIYIMSCVLSPPESVNIILVLGPDRPS